MANATNTFSRRIFLTGAVAASLALTGCGGSTEASDSEAADSLTMATQPWLGYGPWFIAEEQGYFETEGVDVALTMFDNDADMSAAIASGRVDVANVASHTALQYVEQGLPVTVVLLLDASREADAIITSSDIKSVTDLEGQQIAFEEGSVSNLLLNHALTQEGLDISDITPVPMGPSEAATALLSKKVKAAVTYEPYISEAKASGSDFNILYTAAEKEGLISDVLIVTDKALEEKPDAVQKAISAWAPSVEFYNTNTSEAQEIIAAGIGSEASDLVTAFEGVRFFGGEENQEMLSGSYKTEILPSVEEAAIDASIISETADLDSVIDDTFVSNISK